MITPVRLQLSRRKGFDLQALSRTANGLPVVSVARPGKWGNPWRIGMKRGSHNEETYLEESVKDAATAVLFFKEMLDYTNRPYPSHAEIAAQLSGHNLACWCKPGAPCHADVLLDLANRCQCDPAP